MVSDGRKKTIVSVVGPPSDAPIASQSLYYRCSALRAHLMQIRGFSLYFFGADPDNCQLTDPITQLWDLFSLGIPLCYLFDLLPEEGGFNKIFNLVFNQIDHSDFNPALYDGHARKHAIALFAMQIRMDKVMQNIPGCEPFIISDLWNRESTDGLVKVVKTVTAIVNHLPADAFESSPLSPAFVASYESLAPESATPANSKKPAPKNSAHELVETENKYVQDLKLKALKAMRRVYRIAPGVDEARADALAGGLRPCPARRADPAPQQLSVPSPIQTLVQSVSKIHFNELDHYRAIYFAKGSRSRARRELIRLTIHQFYELSTDVYDELTRRKNEKGVPFPPNREDFHRKRNQARRKLATLPVSRFEDLSSDVHFELSRRYPDFKQDLSSSITHDDYSVSDVPDLSSRISSRTSTDSPDDTGNGGNVCRRTRSSEDQYRPSEELPTSRHSADPPAGRTSGDDISYTANSTSSRGKPPQGVAQHIMIHSDFDKSFSLLFDRTVLDSDLAPAQATTAEILRAPVTDPAWSQAEMRGAQASEGDVDLDGSSGQGHLNYVTALTNGEMTRAQQTTTNYDAPAVVARLSVILRTPASYKRFVACRGTVAQTLVNLLQDLLDLDLSFKLRPLLLHALLQLAKTSGRHPRCLHLLSNPTLGQQMAGGGFGDVFKGTIGEQMVATKIMRVYEDSDKQAVLKEFGREALIWRQLSHPNLLPFFGIYYLEERLCLVSPWMVNGNIIRFMRNNPTCTEQRRLSFILDVAGGLKYLHEKNVIHGDLKGVNILVTPSGRACIADFGLSSIVLALTQRITESTASHAGTARYLPPELRGERKRKDFSSDVYSFAGVSYEILIGNVPFFEFREEATVIFKVLDGKRPSKPTSSLDTLCFDRLWNLLESCWKQEPESRPTSVEIVNQLQDLSIQTTVTSADWDPSDTVKFRRSLHIEPTLLSVVELDRMIFGEDVDVLDPETLIEYFFIQNERNGARQS